MDKKEFNQIALQNNYVLTASETITPKNKVLKLPYATAKYLQDNGFAIFSTYYSYNKNATLYNAVMAILKSDKQITITDGETKMHETLQDRWERLHK